MIEGGAAPSSGGGRHQTHGLGGEDGGHGECQPEEEALCDSSDQSEEAISDKSDQSEAF